MTREEAIKDIEENILPVVGGESLRMAIEALSQEPCEDTISRQAAIDALRTCYDTETISMDNGDEYINYGDAVGGIEQLPSAQPEIIRCKDCKHRPTLTDEGITFGFSVVFPDEICPCQCEDGWYNWYPRNDFYCGYAERREEP